MADKRQKLGREKIVSAALSEIHLNGFQGAGINEILDSTNVTKGSLYYHFKSKSELGYAVVSELVHDMIYQLWIKPLEQEGNAIDLLIGALRNSEVMKDSRSLTQGCILLNLAQEMSPIDEGFRIRTKAIFDEWRRAISTIISRDQRRGYVVEDVDPEGVAVFIVASQEGALSLAKNSQDIKVLVSCHDQLCMFLESLRKPNNKI